MANHENSHVTRLYLHKRCDVLADYGLIEDFENELFVLTDESESYLAGELNANELEPDED